MSKMSGAGSQRSTRLALAAVLAVALLAAALAEPVAAEDTSSASGGVAAPSAIAAPPGLWDASPAVPAGRSYVVLDGTARESISNGRDRLYTKADSVLDVRIDGGHVSVVVEGDQSWQGEFAAPAGQPFEVGYQPDAVRYSTRSPSAAGLEWTGEHRGCSGVAGWFAVDQLTVVGEVVTELTLRFSQSCDGGPPLYGKVRWIANDPTVPPGPRTPIPGGLWDTAPSVGAGQSYLVIDGAPGEFVSANRDLLYTQANAAFEVALDGGRITFRLDGDELWQGRFDAMQGVAPPVVGYYPDANGNPVKGGVSFFGGGRGCSRYAGWFAIDQISVREGQLASLTLRFGQTCDGSSVEMHGKLRWNGSDTTAPAGPDRIPTDLWNTTPSVPAGRSYVALQGNPGDWVTQSRSLLYQEGQADRIAATVTGGRIDVDVDDAGVHWDGRFEAMSGVDPIRVGYYHDLRGFPSNPAVGGLSWDGAGRGCNRRAGWFTVDELTVSDGAVATMTLRFFQSCDGGPGMFGKVVIGDERPSLPPGSPVGGIDRVVASPGGIDVRGWALDPDDPRSTTVRVAVDGRPVVDLPADVPRPDVVLTGYGPDHGFEGHVPVGAGAHQVCVTVNNRGAGAETPLGCRSVVVLAGAPFGSVDVARAAPGGVQVGGWMIDPDTAMPADVHVYVDGKGVADTADAFRSDLATLYPGYGGAHGYGLMVPAAPGAHQVCVYGINVGPGGNVLLGCRSVEVPGGAPLGSFDVARQGPSSVVVGGWALDLDTASSIPVHVYVDGEGTALIAGATRADVGALFVGYGDAHGFSAVIPTTPGRHQVCAYGINVGAGGNVLLGCRVVDVPSGSPIGTVDVARGGPGWVSVGGWALDADTGDSILVHVYVDTKGTALDAGLARPDVGAYFYGWGDGHGYATTVSATPGVHDVCVYGINFGPGRNTLLGCRTVTVT